MNLHTHKTLFIILLNGLIFSTLLVANASAQTSSSVFLRDLRQGDRGEDVRMLQKVLNESVDTELAVSGPGASGEETDYFGSRTYAAVIKFQEKYATEILSPIQLMQGTGFVGPMTRKKLNERAVEAGIIMPTQGTGGNGFSAGSSDTPPQDISPSPRSSAPTITSISPVAGANGTEIIINGEGFLLVGNKIQTTLVTLENVSSMDGKTITFRFYSSIVEQLMGGLLLEGVPLTDVVSNPDDPVQPTAQNVPPPNMSFTFPVFINVVNKNGTSNTVRFDLDMKAKTVPSSTPSAFITRAFKSALSIFAATFLPVAEAGHKTCWYCKAAGEANGKWTGLLGSAGGVEGIGAGPAFGGNVIYTIPCLCSESLAFTVRPVAGLPGPYNVSYWSTALKANYAVFPGNWVLGSSAPTGVCSIYAIAWCFNFNAKEIPPVPGIGTSLGM